MGKFFNIVASLMMGTLFIAQTAFSVETVTLLDRGEPYAAMVAQKGIFWVGHSRKQFASEYRVEVYSPEGKLIDKLSLTHSISSMKKVASDTVVMTGINPTAQLTEYTFAKLENGKIRAKTTRIALGGFINFWIGSANGKHYFADMGGNPNDTNTDFNLPAQTIFSSSGSMANYLSTRVRMPIAGTVHNGKLLLVSGEAIGSPKGKIVEVDPQTQQMRVLFTSQNGNLGTLNVIPGTQDVMTNARGENKLIVFDSVTGQIRREIPTQGYSRSFDFTGHCVVVGNDENNSIEVFDLKSQDNKSVINEKITLPSKEFSGIKQIAVDDSTGIVFARSSLPCNPMMEVCDKDINRVVTFGAELGNSIRTLCH